MPVLQSIMACSKPLFWIKHNAQTSACLSNDSTKPHIVVNYVQTTMVKPMLVFQATAQNQPHHVNCVQCQVYLTNAWPLTRFLSPWSSRGSWCCSWAPDQGLGQGEGHPHRLSQPLHPPPPSSVHTISAVCQDKSRLNDSHSKRQTRAKHNA